MFELLGRDQEESARKALLLKRKELRWKLMEASQIQNRAKLEEIRIEANYHKMKMMKITTMARKLREKYVKVAKAARVTELLYKKSEVKLLTHEKFVADEKMQLTKLAVDCRAIGTQLYGPEYKLVNYANIGAKKDNLLTRRLEAAKAARKALLIECGKRASVNSPANRLLEIERTLANSQIKQSQMIIQNGNTKISESDVTLVHPLPLLSASKTPSSSDKSVPSKSIASPKQCNIKLLQKLSPFLRNKYSIHTNSKSKSESRSPIVKKRKPPFSSRLSPLYDLKYSVLKNLAAYRLTTRFSEIGIPLTALDYTHNISPNDYICLPDLIGTCTDKNCIYQHSSNYLMTDIDKLADILSYKPSLTGFKSDPNLSEEENENKCRIRLKQYAARLLAKNTEKPVENIAQNLVKYIRANKSDHDLLTMTRELPKVIHKLVKTRIPEEKSPQSDDTLNSPVNVIVDD